VEEEEEGAAVVVVAAVAEEVVHPINATIVARPSWLFWWYECLQG
jgi:hypothetical protein